MRERRKSGIVPKPGFPLRILELGIYHPEDLRAHLMPFRGRGDWEMAKAAFLDSSLYWGSMPFIPWLEAFDDRPKTPEDLERIEEHKRRMIAQEKRWREKTTEGLLGRGVITEDLAQKIFAKNRWERAVEDGLPRPKNPKRWRTIK